MILKALKSWITLSITGIAVFILAIAAFVFEQKAKIELQIAIEENAVNLLGATRNHVESQYKSILYHKSSTVSHRKAELKNHVSIVYSIIDSYFQEFKKGQITESEAKKHAVNAVGKIRYDNGIGYFWINDTARPFPKMVMHPTIPELNQEVLDHTEFNCALGKNENLFKAFVDICIEKGEGYVDYLWPKPVSGELTAEQPKISFVKLFRPWNWIVGTGVYVDDIDKDVQGRINAVIEELNKTIFKQKIGKDGYFFIFNNENKMLVHPNLADVDLNHLVNPVSGNLLVNEFKQIAFSDNKSMEYLWDKPDYKGQYNFPVKTYITYYEPLGWYIGTSFYKEYLRHKTANLTNTITLFTVIFLILALITSLIISRTVTNPLSKLIRSISNTDKDGIPVDKIPETGITEINALSNTINKMINSISESRKSLEFKNKELQDIIYSVSHDLRSPIVNISGFIGQLETDCRQLTELISEQTNKENRDTINSLLSEEIPESLNYVSCSSKKMSCLLDGLLQVSRAGSVEINRKHVDMNKKVSEVLASIEYQIKENDITVTVDSLPDCIADCNMVDSILSNLIGNSIKYRDSNRNCHIHISGRIENCMSIYCISDNGIGIDPNHQEKIFSMFYRLNPNDDIGGEGLGLTIVTRILERLGGHLRLESEPDKGSKFYIALPAVSSEQYASIS